MSKTTQIKVLFLLLAYSAVLFHSVIPHCHTNDAHAAQHDTPASHHSCDGHHHHQDEHNEPHEHQVCHIESLHGDYLKSESDYHLHADFSSIEITEIFRYFFFEECNSQTFAKPDFAIPIRSCCVASTVLRGPPALFVG